MQSYKVSFNQYRKSRKAIVKIDGNVYFKNEKPEIVFELSSGIVCSCQHVGMCSHKIAWLRKFKNASFILS